MTNCRPVPASLCRAVAVVLAVVFLAGCAPAPALGTPGAPVPVASGNRPPVVSDLALSATSGPAPLTVTATVTASDPDGDALSFEWVTPHQQLRSQARSVTVTFPQPGTYNVGVRVRDGCEECGGYVSATVTVAGWAPGADALLASRGNEIASDLFARMNLERARRGLPALVRDPALDGAAAGYASSLPASGCEHAAGLDVAEILRCVPWGDDGFTAESGSSLHGLGAGVADHHWFMGSPEHRNVLLMARWERIGVAVVCNKITGSRAVVVRFAGTGSGADPMPDSKVFADKATFPGSSATCLG